MNLLRIGTRGSALALWQARHVTELLRSAWPALTIELVEIQTVGDQVRDLPLAQLGGEGLFTKAIQQALLDGRVDVAVHSLKDLPTTPVHGLVLAAVPARGPVSDVLVSVRHRSFPELPVGAIVATSSPRRRAQLLHRRPDLRLVEIRGNVETRVRKLAETDLDALILAEAGLVRLGLERHITEMLDTAWMLPAIGQGALGIECRADDRTTFDMLQRINDPPTQAQVLAERALLRGLGGGCQVPIGAATRLDGTLLTLRGVVLDERGSKRLEQTITGPWNDAEVLGGRLAQDLLEHGASDMLNRQG